MKLVSVGIDPDHVGLTADYASTPHFSHSSERSTISATF